jgi:GxxExxY protein
VTPGTGAEPVVVLRWRAVEWCKVPETRGDLFITIGAALAVHRKLGPGFLESTYHAAMRVSLDHRAIPFDCERRVDISFEGVFVGRPRIDLIAGNQIVVELKAVRGFREVHFAQLKSYLRAANLHIGLLINFNAPTLRIRRMVLD